ncbi:MAG: hypothetical protein ABIT10_09485 [Alteraurantiacibacter sp.]
MDAEMTRSDVLRSLIWPNAGLLMGLVAAISADADDWILMTLVIVFCLFMGLYGSAYVFFAVKDPDALRSEKYKLHKMAIEQGLVGDSLMGLRKLDEMPEQTKLIDVSPSSETPANG